MQPVNNLGNDPQPLQVVCHEHRSQEDNHTELLLYATTGAVHSDSNITYLGVVVSDNFQWETHITGTTAKANRNLGFLRPNIHVFLPLAAQGTGLLQPDKIQAGVCFISLGSVPGQGRYTHGSRAKMSGEILLQGLPPPQQCHSRAGRAGLGFPGNLQSQLQIVLARQDPPRQGGYRLRLVPEEELYKNAYCQ